MLIISKKKDYYDGVASMGIDKTIVYDRKLTEFEMNDVNFPEIFKKSNDWRDKNLYGSLKGYKISEKYKKKYDSYSYFIIFFCDKIYIGWEFMKKSIGYETILTKHTTYDLTYVKKVLNTESSMYYNKNFNDSINNILNSDMMDLHRKYNSPILLIDINMSLRYLGGNYNHNPVFSVNPVLKSYKFYKIFDTYSAFQEIQMFVSGVLTNPENNMVELSNDVRIKKHGFDKWSFRKEPENKK